MKRGIVWAILLSLVGVGGVWTAQAATFNSSNFSINGNLGDSAAGGQNSTNYQLTSAAGESTAGNSASKSYKLGQGYIPTLENSLQVVTQPNGLAAYFPLDDVTSDGGQMLDESQNSNNGFYTTSSVSTSGKVGNAWNDLNNNQFAQTPAYATYPSGNTMAVSAWIKPTNLSGQKAIVTKWDYAQNGGITGQWAFQLSPTAGQIRVFISDGPFDAGNNYLDTTNANITAGVWTHVSMVYDGSLTAANRVKVFVNGVGVNSTITGTFPTTLATASNPVTIGEFPGLSRPFAGSIDEVKIYSRPLTQPEVKADYDASNAGVPAGLSLGSITPGTSRTSVFDSIVQTSAGGYSLAINQNNNLTSSGNTIPAVGGSIGSPAAWSEGATKGLGFTLYGTNATAIPGTWASGSAYAALPGTATSFYTRTNYTGGAKDVLNMRLRLDTLSSQPSGDYANQMIITGTMIP